MAVTKVAVEPMLSFITKVVNTHLFVPMYLSAPLYMPYIKICVHCACPLIHSSWVDVGWALVAWPALCRPSLLSVPAFRTDGQPCGVTFFLQVTAVRVAAQANPAAAKPLREQVCVKHVTDT